MGPGVDSFGSFLAPGLRTRDSNFLFLEPQLPSPNSFQRREHEGPAEPGCAPMDETELGR